MRIYWPWWLFPVAFAFWFVGAMMRLAAWPFRAMTRQHRPRTTVTIRIQDNEKSPSTR